MPKETWSYDDFLATVGSDDRPFVNDIHAKLTSAGCQIDIKTAKSGFVVSYLLDQKTILNYVFRKKGLLARIYANHVASYMEVIDTFPDALVKQIQGAPLCKRLVDPQACNPRCAMGYDFIVRGERLQKCRYNAFLILCNEQNIPGITALLEHELQARKSAA